MGIPPNKVMVNSLIKAAARAGNPAVAVSVFAEAKELGVRIDKKTVDNFIQANNDKICFTGINRKIVDLSTYEPKVMLANSPA
eukprot:3103486-Pyramimonas_sp.AAC.1